MTDLRAAVAAELPRALSDLAELVAIPSVSSLPERKADVARSAELVRRWAEEAGAAETTIMQVGDGHPAVFAHWPAPEGMPTICLYAHHDVQPTGDPSLWTTGDPFTVVERDGRLYGRGVGDDKAGVIGHLLAIRALGGNPPVGVKLFVEGEEEVGSASLPAIIERWHDDLTADAYLILDATNWEVGDPTFTTTLRGLAEVYVELQTSSKALHSGIFGGVVPDALTAMCKLLGTLVDDDGNLQVEGLVDGPAPDLVYPEDRLREETGLLDGVRWYGSGSVVERLWTKHSVAVLALDATPVKDASNTLYPTCRAKVGMRVPPGADAATSQRLLGEHLQRHAPFGAKVTITPGESGEAFTIPFHGPVADAATAAFREAWGKEPTFAGAGGSIPLAAQFDAAFPGSPVLVTAVLDPTSAMHAPDESVDVGDLEKAALAEALILTSLAARAG